MIAPNHFEGRLGSQLFRIAAAIGIAARNGTTFGIPPWEHAAAFAPLPPARPRPRRVLLETTLTTFEPQTTSALLFGNFLSRRYFSGQDAAVRAALRPMQPMSPEDITGIHIRRGDFVPSMALPPEWFLTAATKLPGPVRVYSDDPAWCRDTFPQWEIAPEAAADTHFWQLAACRRLILSPSTFGWWAAYLGQPERVIAPARWPFFHHGDSAEPEWEVQA